MKKNVCLLFFCITVILMMACSGTAKKKDKEEQKIDKLKTDSTSILAKTDLPQKVDLSIDINPLSLEELRLYYNYVYATHGMHFTEADLYAFFCTNTKWYDELINDLWEKDKLPLSYSDVKLSADEQTFTDAVKIRLNELKEKNFQLVNGYSLGNVNNIVNRFQFKDIDDTFLKKLSENNFVVTNGKNLQLFHVYEENDYRQLPNFITTDLYLQTFHMYFSYILKSLEQQKLSPMLQEICFAMYDESMQLTHNNNTHIKELAEYNTVFYAIPYYLLTGKKLSIPNRLASLFETEIKNINTNVDNISDFLDYTDVYFPYSLFKPRGHYARKPEMQQYFKAMMWLQTAPFCRDNQNQMKNAIFASFILKNAKTRNGKSLMSLYKGIYEPIVFLVGLPDNLSFMDISNFLTKNHINNLDMALSADNTDKINQMLVELSKTRNKIKPKIKLSCEDKVNFMPQRYLIDNDVIQNLVDVTQNAKKAFPRGLEVFAAFGSSSANDLLTNFYKDKDKWNKYENEMSKLKSSFSNYKNWNTSIYNKWIESLLYLQKKDKNYPSFMQTPQWGYKDLNTSLASLAELKHDAILYAEQPSAAECGGGGPPEPIVRGYVEPNLQFWTKLQEMIVLTKNILDENDLMTDDIKGKTETLNDYVKFLIQVSRKEIAKKPLSDEEYTTIQKMGSSIEYFSLSILDPDLSVDSWSLVEGPDKSIAVVADIYTRNIPGCEKNGILHVATGNASNIYVVVEINGYLYLTKGATFSYYEFVQPTGSRLNDEEWQKMLEEGKAPSVEKWMNDILINVEPTINERVFYSSGC